MTTPAPTRTRRDWFVLIAIGLAAGFLSGFLGVGGGTIIVPALTGFLAFNQRLAAGTSLAAIVGSCCDLLALKAALVADGTRVRLERRTKNIKALLERALVDGFTGFASVSSGTTAATLEVRPLS